MSSAIIPLAATALVLVNGKMALNVFSEARIASLDEGDKDLVMALTAIGLAHLSASAGSFYAWACSNDKTTLAEYAINATVDTLAVAAVVESVFLGTNLVTSLTS